MSPNGIAVMMMSGCTYDFSGTASSAQIISSASTKPRCNPPTAASRCSAITPSKRGRRHPCPCPVPAAGAGAGGGSVNTSRRHGRPQPLFAGTADADVVSRGLLLVGCAAMVEVDQNGACVRLSVPHRAIGGPRLLVALLAGLLCLLASAPATARPRHGAGHAGQRGRCGRNGFRRRR